MEILFLQQMGLKLEQLKDNLIERLAAELIK